MNKFFVAIFFLVNLILMSEIKAEGKNNASSAEDQKSGVPNIHNTGFRCTECHVKEAIEGIDNPETVVLIENNDIIKLCNKCHEGDNLHPVGKDPLLAKTPVKIPVYFPLGKGINKGKLVCTSCHIIHSSDARDKLLRGYKNTFKKDTPAIENPFKDRREMCMACHEEGFITKSPHNKEEGSCAYCHTSDPNKAKDVSSTFAKDILRLCTFCHEKVTEEHVGKNNPFNSQDLKQEIKRANLFMINEKPVCTTCHDPHGESQNPKFLRDNFIELAEKSRFVNPHWQGVFCLSCHETKPVEGQKVTIKFNGNINRTCMWCHITNPVAVADIHPVDIEAKPSEFIKVPQDFPLVENKLTCITCHDYRLQEKNDKTMKNENRQFLRGKAYSLGEDRSGNCFQCHVELQFKMLNAHDQIDDQGELYEESCKYCHTSKPDRDSEGLEKIDNSLPNLSALCFRCHSDGPHPGKINHILKISQAKLERKIDYEKTNNVSYPLDTRGNIFCATCHNPHEAGIVKKIQANKGADTRKRARLPIVGGYLCFTCHDKDKDATLQKILSEK